MQRRTVGCARNEIDDMDCCLRYNVNLDNVCAAQKNQLIVTVSF